MRPPANKAKLHTYTYMRTDTDTDNALITSESTEAENSKRGLTLPTPDINVPVSPSHSPQGEAVQCWKDQGGRGASSLKGRLTLYTQIRRRRTKRNYTRVHTDTLPETL